MHVPRDLMPRRDATSMASVLGDTVPPTEWFRAELGDLTVAEASESPILKGMLFSLAFVVTYQWVILVIIFLSTLQHHISRTLSRCPQSCSKKHESSIPTPARDRLRVDSHLDNSLTGWKDELRDEQTPLLRKGLAPSRTPWLKLISRRLRAALIYHPVSIRDIPGNDTTAFVTLLTAINIFYAVYNITFTRPLIYVLADRAGLLFVCNLPWLYFLSAKNQPFRLLLGTSYESLNILHRGLGKWLALLAIVHGAGMVVVWYDFLLPRGLDVWWYLSRHVIWTGLLAFTCYIVLTMTSKVEFRQWWYELFLATHIILQAGGLTFLWLHHHRARGNVGAALFIFLIDRVILRYALKTRTFQADLKVAEDGETVIVSANWSLANPRSAMLSWSSSWNLWQGWDNSDHVFLTVPALAKKHAIQAHPFTIALAAPDKHHKDAWFNLIIRARDGFTRDLLNYAREHSSTIVRMDGPYGSTHAYDMLANSDAALIVAGGSGIAVAYPLLWQLLHGRRSSDRPRGGPLKLCLLWVVHDAAHITWIGHERLDELEQMGLQLILPPSTKLHGRPDMSRLVRDTVADMHNADADTKISVVVSGPDAMNREVRNTCAGLAWQGIDLHVAVEVFDW